MAGENRPQEAQPSIRAERHFGPVFLERWRYQGMPSFQFKDYLIDLSTGRWRYISTDGTIISQGSFLQSLGPIECLSASRPSLILLRRKGPAELMEKRRQA